MSATTWYFPSWNGDIRLLAEDDKTRLIVHAPTPAELAAVLRFRAVCIEKKWDSKGLELDRIANYPYRDSSDKQECVLNAPIKKVGPALAKIVQPSRAVLTALLAKVKLGPQARPYYELRVASGELSYRTRVADGHDALPDLVASSPTAEKMDDNKKEKKKKSESLSPVPDSVALATVRRPTPSCPSCVEGAIAPAYEVLGAFMTEAEHAEWARDRSITVTGGVSGHRYRIAHRHSDPARRWGRICVDLDDGGILHFHDWRVPPEEEVLAAKLILEHREPWLRNEATCLGGAGSAGGWLVGGGGGFRDVYPNPWGDGSDGVYDSNFAAGFGATLWNSLQAEGALRRRAGRPRGKDMWSL